MGAEVFYNKAKGNNANDVFKQESEHACYEHGHGGYTGTIAEKNGYTMSRKPKDIGADEWIEMVEDFDEDDTSQEHYTALKSDFEIYDDKWGDALCVKTDDGFIFCGWASS
jgi:hypothetical protein